MRESLSDGWVFWRTPSYEIRLSLHILIPYSRTHLFWEQLKQLGFAFREIRREDVTDEEIEELLKASEPILAILSRIQRRREQTKVVKVRL